MLFKSVPNKESESIVLLLNNWIFSWVLPSRWTNYVIEGDKRPTDDPIMEWCFASTEEMCNAHCAKVQTSSEDNGDDILFGESEPTCNPLYISYIIETHKALETG
jgi:hypothetical protein